MYMRPVRYIIALLLAVCMCSKANAQTFDANLEAFERPGNEFAECGIYFLVKKQDPGIIAFMIWLVRGGRRDVLIYVAKVADLEIITNDSRSVPFAHIEHNGTKTPKMRIELSSTHRKQARCLELKA